MIRVVFFLAIALVAALGLTWIADRPGSVVVTWLGRTVELQILPAIVALLAVTTALALFWSLLQFVFRLPSLISIASRSRRRSKGFEAVARGMVAVSAGDARTAQKQATEAQRLLGQEPLTLLLAAQSAQLSGEGSRAEKAFSAMLERADTRIVGLRGLHIEATRKGDAQAARFYAEEGYKLAPAADWASDATLAHRCEDRDWLGAMALVEQAASRRLIDKPTARRQRAILLTADALDRGAHEPDAALRAAQEAVRLDPGLPPAAAYLGRRLSEKADYAKASKVLEAAWKVLPHPDIAEAYLDVRLGDAAQDRLKRAKTLQRLAPRDPESRLIVARAAIDARDFRTARENLETLVLEQPTVRACVLMAELEEAEGGRLGLVREWLARASRAPRDKAWVADGRVSETWWPVSPSGKLGGYVWETPPQAPGGLLIEEIKSAPPMMVEAPAAPRPAETAANEPPRTVAEEAPQPIAEPPPPPQPVAPAPAAEIDEPRPEPKTASRARSASRLKATTTATEPDPAPAAPAPAPATPAPAILAPAPASKPPAQAIVDRPVSSGVTAVDDEPAAVDASRPHDPSPAGLEPVAKSNPIVRAESAVEPMPARRWYQPLPEPAKPSRPEPSPEKEERLAPAPASPGRAPDAPRPVSVGVNANGRDAAAEPAPEAEPRRPWWQPLPEPVRKAEAPAESAPPNDPVPQAAEAEVKVKRWYQP